MPAVSGLVAFLACLLAFAGLAEVIGQPTVPPIDTSTTMLLHDLASPGLDVAMSAVTGLGSTLVLAALAGLAVVALAAGGRRIEAFFVAVALAASLALNDVLKLYFGRPRPALDWAELRPEHAFPSGHAMNSLVAYVALALIAWRLWGRRAGIVAMLSAVALAIVIGSSRVYLGVHWLTDVVGGYLAAVMLLLVVAAIFRIRWHAARPATVEPDAPD